MREAPSVVHPHNSGKHKKMKHDALKEATSLLTAEEVDGVKFGASDTKKWVGAHVRITGSVCAAIPTQ